MEVLLLGTGGPRGWPEPGCTCASCSTGVGSGTSRAPACALVDGALLLDGHDALPRHDLGRVRQVLLTGTQEQPARWLDAAGGGEPVQVLGPVAALEACRASGPRVEVVPVAPGDRHVTSTGHEVRAVQQGSGLAWSVTGRDQRLLYAPGQGHLRVEGAYDTVLLGLGSPRRGAPAEAPAEDLASALAQLRRDGAVGASTDVRAIGHDHHAEPPDVLHHHLSAWGVRDAQDGVAVRPAPPPRPLAGRTLVLGGVRSGKSALAERLVAAQPTVTYVATGGSRTSDEEWQQRVAAHRARRPASWRTVETTDLVTCLREADGAVLVDCLGTWLSALLDQHDVWDGGPLAAVEAEVEALLAAWRGATRPLVAVTNEVGSGVVPATPSGRLFRDLLGRLNARVAAESETVLLTVAGIPLPLRAAPRA